MCAVCFSAPEIHNSVEYRNMFASILLGALCEGHYKRNNEPKVQQADNSPFALLAPTFIGAAFVIVLPREHHVQYAARTQAGINQNNYRYLIGPSLVAKTASATGECSIVRS